MRVLGYLDGTVADPDDPQIKVADLGLLRGDGVFETVLIEDGEPRELDLHLDRLARSARMMELPEPDDAQWERAIRAVVDAWPDDSEIAMKLIYTRGLDSEPDSPPTAFALGLEISPRMLRERTEGIAAITLERGIEPGLAERAPWLLLGAKTLSYAVNMAALREADRRGASDVIFTATDGSVLEGPTVSVVLVRDRTLYTPPPIIGILPGTTQAAVYRGAERAGFTAKIERLTVDDLFTGDGVFVASSVRKLTRVHTLDGKHLPDSTELHRELSAAYESVYR
ncbi:aminodeoxychorismate lyase [Amycolatopsis sp. AA4]|uniref:aminodeoxychorismate lyase n=1 Tax=Actinomycetes TaxID=1760 RepID=UPI0001B57511|nr:MULTISPECIES: aminodeoxychorismate lyase [Actinomycetes]ATY11317.1 aminodeoxychorismate lyase [Amycolatopsis sp. AA4]EFL06917.1 amino acid aminotransferase [Streptomyces sp. AA4]